MEPGPELDALVATEVVGWRLGVDELGLPVWEDPVAGFTYEDGASFTPSANWLDAGLVVDKMEEDHAFSLNSCGTWHLASFMPVGLGMVSMAEGSTIPHAICLAALKAKRGEVA